MRLPSELNAALPTPSAWPVSGPPISLPLSPPRVPPLVPPPRPRRLRRRGEDALAVGAERRAPRAIRIARVLLADLVAPLGAPHPPRLVPSLRRRGDDALAVGAERRAPRTIRRC